MQATVKSEISGDMSISLNTALEAEPLALYVDPQDGALALKLHGGLMMPLLHDADGHNLAEQEEVTIESFVGGLLAAGYRVGIRSMAY